MTKFTLILRFCGTLNILLQVNGKIVPNIQKFPTGITWENATKSCGENGLEYDYNALKNVTDVVYGAEFWIGLAVYRVLTPWIEIIDRKTMKSIALCKRFCETNRYIGYKNITKDCVCLGDNFADRNYIQIDNCTKKMDNAFFVYKELGDGVITTDSSTDGNCITLCCPWCNGREEKQQTDCHAKNVNIATKCEVMLDLSVWGQTYSAAMESCFSKNRLLIPPTFCQNNSNYPGRTMWTNIFRDEREEKLTQNEGGNSSPVRCLTGVLHQQEGQIMLNITERDCSTKIEYYVCIASKIDTKDTIEVSISPPAKTTTDIKPTNRFETTRPDLTSTQSDLSSPSLRKTTTYEATVTKNYEEKTFTVKPTEHRHTEVSNKTQSNVVYDKHNSITGIIIGVAVAIIVIVLGIFIAVLIYKKRRCHMKDNIRESQWANKDPRRTYEGLNFGVVQSSGTVDHEYAVFKTKTPGSHELRQDTKAPTNEETFYENQ